MFGTGSIATPFQSPTSYAAGTGPYCVLAGDFNKDGRLDLAVSNQTSNNVSILLGAAGGTFGAPNNFAVGTTPVFMAAGDYNGDGKIDLAVANNGSPNISILLNTSQ